MTTAGTMRAGRRALGIARGSAGASVYESLFVGLTGRGAWR